MGLVISQIVTHSATFDFWPARRHAARSTPHGERPLSVEEYEAKTGKVAKDRQIEIWRAQGVSTEAIKKNSKVTGYND